jgi:hypothetical protein
MVTFFDGPAKGAELTLRRTPLFLRVVIGTNAVIDALDMPEDEPTSEEKVYAYRVVDGTLISGFMCGSKKGCIQFKSAMYRLCNIQPEESILRNRKLWEKWVEEIQRSKET